MINNVIYTDVTKQIVLLINKLHNEYNIKHIDLSKVRFVLSNYLKDNAVDYYGSCRPTDQIFIKYVKHEIHYIIEIVYNNIKSFDINRLVLLILHELMHIPTNGFDINHKHYLTVIEHDYTEFCKIAQLVNGIDWTDRRTKLPDIIKDEKVIIKKESIMFKEIE